MGFPFSFMYGDNKVTTGRHTINYHKIRVLSWNDFGMAKVDK